MVDETRSGSHDDDVAFRWHSKDCREGEAGPLGLLVAVSTLVALGLEEKREVWHKEDRTKVACCVHWPEGEVGTWWDGQYHSSLAGCNLHLLIGYDGLGVELEQGGSA